MPKKKYQHALLPDRYSRLRSQIAQISGATYDLPDDVLGRVEARRFKAEDVLRETLALFWSGKQNGKLGKKNPSFLLDSPLDLLRHFGGYAKATYLAMAEECGTLFNNEKTFRGLLEHGREWIVEEILPLVRFSGKKADRIIRLNETLIKFCERIGEDEDEKEDESATLAELILAEYDKAIRDPEKAAEHKVWNGPWGGDWERLLEDTLVHSIRTDLRADSDSYRFFELQLVFCSALRSERNRSDARDFLVVALETEDPIVLAHWWEKSTAPEAESPVGKNLDRLRKDCGWSFDELAKKTGLEKSLILGHINEGKGATPKTLKLYADAFSKQLKRTVSVAEIES